MRAVTTTDLELLTRQALSGDATAFGRLIRLYDRDLRGVVWAVVRSGPDTDDVMQSAYEKAFRSLDSFAGRSSLKTWLHSICYRTAIDFVRYEGRRRHGDVDAMIDLAGSASPADEVIARGEVESAFALLDQDQRTVLMLTAKLGFSFDEVAEITGMNRGTVASRAARAKKRIRRELES